MKRIWMVGLLMWSACGDVTSSASGNHAPWGEDGPYATRTTHEWMWHGARSRPITVVLPSARGTSLPAPTRTDAVVLVQGGLVERDRYLWLAQHLATRGYAVVLPEHVGWLAFFDPGMASAALDHLESRPAFKLGTATVGGHSLGGVVAASTAIGDDRFAGLFLLASQPQDGDDAEGYPKPMLSIAGRKDELQALDDSRKGWERFGGPKWFAEVEDLTHFSWTSPGRDPTTLRETEAPSPDLTTARRGGLYALDAFLDGVNRDDATAWDALNGIGATPRGLTLTAGTVSP